VGVGRFPMQIEAISMHQNKWQLDHQTKESAVRKLHDNQRIISA